MWKPTTHDSFMPMPLRWKWKCSWLARSPSRPLPCFICDAIFCNLKKKGDNNLSWECWKNLNCKNLVKIQPLNLNKTQYLFLESVVSFYRTVKYINSLNDRTKIVPFEFWNNNYLGKGGCAKSDEFSEKCLGGEVPFNPKIDVADYGNFKEGIYSIKLIQKSNFRVQNMTQLLLLGKFEYGGGRIFKLVLEC